PFIVFTYRRSLSSDASANSASAFCSSISSCVLFSTFPSFSSCFSLSSFCSLLNILHPENKSITNTKIAVLFIPLTLVLSIIIVPIFLFSYMESINQYSHKHYSFTEKKLSVSVNLIKMKHSVKIQRLPYNITKLSLKFNKSILFLKKGGIRNLYDENRYGNNENEPR